MRIQGRKIRNPGNSCFVISVVNAVLASQNFTKALMDPVKVKELRTGKGVVFYSLKKIAQSNPKNVQDVKSIRTNVALNHIKENKKNNKKPENITNYDDGKEHDPVGFMRSFLDCLTGEFRPQFTWVRSLTEFVINEKHTCQNCKHEATIEVEEIILQVTAKKSNLEDAIKETFEMEIMEKPHNCSNPNNTVMVTKSLVVTPPVLLIQVNRFKVNPETENIEKLKNEVEPSLRINLNETEFLMDASINHIGMGPDSGHCVTNINQHINGLFSQCSDENIKQNVTAKKVNLNQTYLSIYSKHDVEKQSDKKDNVELEAETREWSKSDNEKKNEKTKQTSKHEIDDDGYTIVNKKYRKKAKKSVKFADVTPISNKYVEIQKDVEDDNTSETIAKKKKIVENTQPKTNHENDNKTANDEETVNIEETVTIDETVAMEDIGPEDTESIKQSTPSTKSKETINSPSWCTCRKDCMWKCSRCKKPCCDACTSNPESFSKRICRLCEKVEKVQTLQFLLLLFVLLLHLLLLLNYHVHTQFPNNLVPALTPTSSSTFISCFCPFFCVCLLVGPSWLGINSNHSDI